METDVAQPAVGAACVAMLRLLAQPRLRAELSWAGTASASWSRFTPPESATRAPWPSSRASAAA